MCSPSLGFYVGRWAIIILNNNGCMYAVTVMCCLLNLIGEQTKECEALHLRSADYASQLGDLNATVRGITFTFFSVVSITYMLIVLMLGQPCSKIYSLDV